jgi:hypothetical protein
MAKKDSNLGLARYLRRDRAERCEMSAVIDNTTARIRDHGCTGAIRASFTGGQTISASRLAG